MNTSKRSPLSARHSSSSHLTLPASVLCFLTSVLPAFSQVHPPSLGYTAYGIRPEKLVYGWTFDNGGYTADDPSGAMFVKLNMPSSINTDHAINQAAPSFNGNNAYMYVRGFRQGEDPLNGYFTVSHWVYWTGMPGYTATKDGAYNSLTCGDSNIWEFYITANGQLTWRVTDKNATSTFLSTSNWAIASNTWVQVAGVMTGNQTVKLYVNGSLVTNTFQVQYYSGFTSDLMLGIRAGAINNPSGCGAGFWNGYIDEFMEWEIGLTDDQIRYLYEMGKQGLR